ncbi:MAG: imidazole glycerol phosphate synthase subunit HisH [Thaumarchaeota archaeon]|nr:imidazole glycerol phosphate synthase subunit HisH [Nitrososphaerota archaeon]RNJ71743.1 MAG: imidazole glycerol phosphate synthase subunit HisH [Thaumarchaeota archaeon S13]RNJ75974.1 MAG: imidazole glycerol phosphate synthase subunit HisH [Thaumarchaeota archaeon S15]MDD9809959.1 imidazole glycerol phosphate synthase subunit HisH [Nitrososphaerota archaeon]MDD9825641.1 imidazole glycerol phosphate synthase subunit HisH [Nitrososphaerota archaeon]
MRVAVLDYGAGNLFSIRHALERSGAEVETVTEPARAGSHDGIVLPGVGSFDTAMRRIGATALKEWAAGAPVLGICLGMEMFFERSEEGSLGGLGVMRGEVVGLPQGLKAPHMGWNSLELTGDSMLTGGIGEGTWAYFVHSYMARPADASVIAAEADYGARIPAIVQSGEYVGTQFHPEKSGAAGRAMVANFVGACRR